MNLRVMKALLRDREYRVKSVVGALVLSCVLGLSGCQKKPTAEVAPEEAVTTSPTPKPEATPERKVAAATPAPTPTATPELAPPGVFYLLTTVSVETSDGILGLKPGQMVRQVRPGFYSAGNAEVSLRPDQITNDMAIARRFAAQDQKNQAAIQQRLASHTAPGAASPAGSPGRMTPPPMAQGTPDPKIAARNELFQRRTVVIQQMDQLAASINPLAARYGSWDYAAKKSAQVYSLMQQYNALQRQRANIDAQISQMR